MPDPRDADFPGFEFWENGLVSKSMPLCEERRNHDLREKIPLMPSVPELHAHMVLGRLPLPWDQAGYHELIRLGHEVVDL